MYPALWRVLPGGRAAKVVQRLLLLVAVVTVCFVWVFPAVATLLVPYTDAATLDP